MSLDKSTQWHQHRLLTLLLTARTFCALFEAGMGGHQRCTWASAAEGYFSSRELIVLRWDSNNEGKVSLIQVTGQTVFMESYSEANEVRSNRSSQHFCICNSNSLNFRLFPVLIGVLCDDFISDWTQPRDEHRPVLLLSSLPDKSQHFWNSGVWGDGGRH